MRLIQSLLAAVFRRHNIEAACSPVKFKPTQTNLKAGILCTITLILAYFTSVIFGCSKNPEDKRFQNLFDHECNLDLLSFYPLSLSSVSEGV